VCRTQLEYVQSHGGKNVAMRQEEQCVHSGVKGAAQKNQVKKRIGENRSSPGELFRRPGKIEMSFRRTAGRFLGKGKLSGQKSEKGGEDLALKTRAGMYS